MAEFNLTPVFRMEKFIDAIMNGTTPPEPKFREEFYFAKVAGMDVELPTPITRREFYLAKYAGMDVDLPAPVTRDEMYLALACGLGVEPPEPVFRDEYWLYELSGGGKWSWKTVSGSLIHITDALASPMQKCEVSLEPIQDLHGQDAPYPAGGGKNKLNTEGTDTNNGYVSGKYLNNAGAEIGGYGGYITEYTPIKPSTEYTLSGIYGSAPSICFYDSNKNYISSVQYLGVTSKSFTTPADAAYYRASVKTPDMETSGQLEEGSTATPWSPYKNICPITGWTGCEVTRTGKNLFDETQYQNLYSNYEYVSENYRCRFIQLAPNTIYTVSQRAGTAASTPILLLNNVPKVNNTGYFDFRSISSVKTFTTDATGKLYIGLLNSNDTEYNARLTLCKLQIELGSTATEYEPYSGTTLSVTFPDTVYGGKYEFVSGGLKSRYKKFVVDENTSISYSSSAKGFYVNGGWNDALYTQNTETGRVALAQAVFCDTLKYDANIVFGQTGFRFTYYTDGWAPLMFVPSVTSKAEAQAWLAENNVTFLYPVANPVEISLTPQEISTLAGENNVWSNGDSVEITYKAQA